MGGTTPSLALPYPTGTDRVADGDNAIEALARRVEARMPWGWVAYAQITSDVGATNTYIPGLAINWTPNNTRRYRVTGYVLVKNSSAGANQAFQLLDGGTMIQQAQASLPVANTGLTMIINHIIDPTAGAKTYALYMAQSGGNSTVSAAGVCPSFLMIEDIGPRTLT